MIDEKQQKVAYEEKDLILFEEGIFGFEDYKRFIPLAVDENDEDGDMLYLQSVDEVNLSFLVINPFLLKEDYHPVLADADEKALAAESEGDLAYYVLCVIKETPEASTVNLKCPVAVNVKTRQARQVVLDDSKYRLRHTLQEFADKEGAQYADSLS